jgi:hypothetical protein
LPSELHLDHIAGTDLIHHGYFAPLAHNVDSIYIKARLHLMLVAWKGFAVFAKGIEEA